MPPRTPDAEAQAQSYGGFELAGMHLALPMAALREVVPLGPLIPLPCKLPCVLGGLGLRGVVVPVVDLRGVLGYPPGTCPYPSVIIMRHEGRILGLLADGVSGVFSAHAKDVHRVVVAGDTAAAFAQTLRRESDGEMVSVLSPSVLASLPQVPMVADPEPAPVCTADESEASAPETLNRPLMLMRCGAHLLAIDALAVHSSLSGPMVERSVLARGACRGVIDFAGHKLPAVHLLEHCGFPVGDPGSCSHAAVVRLAQGMVAFLIDEVVDVVRVRQSEVLHVPAFALPHPEWFAGTLPASALPEDASLRARTAAAQYLLLDSDAFLAGADVQGWASANTPGQSVRHDAVPGAALADVKATAGHAGRSMITYALGAETATPLEQIVEILPYGESMMRVEARGPMIGLMINRGRSIPVVCLSLLTAGRPAPLDASSSVLVVRSDKDLVGFAVPGLKAIEPSDWEPELPSMGALDQDALSQAVHSRKLALIGGASAPRMLPVLDLQRVARGLQEQALR